MVGQWETSPDGVHFCLACLPEPYIDKPQAWKPDLLYVGEGRRDKHFVVQDPIGGGAGMPVAEAVVRLADPEAYPPDFPPLEDDSDVMVEVD